MGDCTIKPISLVFHALLLALHCPVARRGHNSPAARIWAISPSNSPHSAEAMIQPSSRGVSQAHELRKDFRNCKEVPGLLKATTGKIYKESSRSRERVGYYQPRRDQALEFTSTYGVGDGPANATG